MTRQRLLIKDIIDSSDKHLTADEIYRIAKLKMPKIALGTVYRNLGRLCEDKEIRLINVKGFSDCYDKNINPHGHLICDMCGSVTDFPFKDIGPMIESILKIKLISYEIHAHYICPACSAMAERDNKSR